MSRTDMVHVTQYSQDIISTCHLYFQITEGWHEGNLCGEGIVLSGLQVMVI